MKSGTAQKLLLNMLSTSVMIQLGRVQGSRMVDMQLSNLKLLERGARMVADQTGLNESASRALLMEQGSVRRAIEQWNSNNPPQS
jgi:N-acetylmuramic acid 6-phosphate etherase